MEHDSSRTGYHQPRPKPEGLEFSGAAWDEDLEEDKNYFEEPQINLIWAQGYTPDGRQGAIGFRGSMPWHLKEDLQHFQELTISHPVVMGRKTWESLNPRFRPLSQRDNIVVSHDPAYRAPGASVAENLEEALHMASQPSIPDDGIRRGEIWIIGGSQLYSQLIDRADHIYVTDIDLAVEADSFAPNVDDLVKTGTFEVSADSGWLVPVGTVASLQTGSDSSAGTVSRYRFRTLTRAEEGSPSAEEEL